MAPQTPPPDRDSGSSADAPPGWETLGRVFAHEGSEDDEETQRVRRWMKEHPGDADLLDALDRAADSVTSLADEPVDVESALRTVKARMQAADVRPITSAPRPASPIRSRQAAPSPWMGRAWKIAAAISAIVIGARLWQANARQADVQQFSATKVESTGVGERRTISLADGSTIVLAPGSRISVDAKFGERDRQVMLEGEGYFDIVHDEARPFTVRAGNALIRDVGTTFVVRMRADSSVRVVVTSGIVRLERQNLSATDAVELHEHDVGVLTGAGQPTAERGAATGDDVAWKEGRLVFRESSMSEVRNELRRWYGIELVIDDSALAKRHVTHTISGESPAAALDVIAQSMGASKELRGDTVYLRPRR